jgi:type I restriction-modification system DNA methylase subunit
MTRRSANGKNNLALRGIDADFGPEHADTFRHDLHPDLRSFYVLANPPFNDSDWFRKDDDVRWQYSVPPRGNANFAGVQHFIHHLAPHSMAGFVLVRFWFLVKSTATRVFNGADKETPVTCENGDSTVSRAPAAAMTSKPSCASF